MPAGRNSPSCAIFLAVVLWPFYTVGRLDRSTGTGYQAVTGRYVVGLGVAVAAMLVSAFLPDEPRLVVWAGVAVAWVVGIRVAGRSGLDWARGRPPTVVTSWPGSPW